MRIAFCDDEQIQSIFLKELVREWEQLEKVCCEITTYGSAEEMLFENSEVFPFDLIILDIEMNRMNGMELARRIREKDKKVMIAFLSNNRGFVFEGYEVQAVRYLIKPVTKEQLFPLLGMAQDAITQEKQYIIAGGVSDRFKLATDEIYYVEALGHYVKIHTVQKEYEIKMNINELSIKLGKGFIMPHRSFLVNLLYIDRITKTDCVLTDNILVPISRNSYKEVNQAFIEYYKGL